MSDKAIRFALKCKNLKPQEKYVLIVLCDYHVVGTGSCSPSISRLAKDTGLTAPTITKNIQGLESKGLIEVLRGENRKQRNRYNIAGLVGKVDAGEGAAATAMDKAFDVFWQEYPRKDGKTYALKTWKKLKPSHDLAVHIIKDVRKRTVMDYSKRERQFIPMPSSYLNGRRWEDELTEDTHLEKRMDWL